MPDGSPARPGADEQPQVVIVNGCTDMEQHARSFNEGYETAVTQGLADDPTLAGDWLDEHDRQVKIAVLAEAANRIEAAWNESEAGQPFGASRGALGFDKSRQVVAEFRSGLTR